METRPPTVKHWRLAQISTQVETLAASPYPLTSFERGHYEAHLAQAAYWLGMAAQYIPALPSRREPPPSRPPEELLVPPHSPLSGRRSETWRESPVAEQRYRRLRLASREVTRVTQSLGGFGRGSRLVTFSCPSGVKAPPIEGVAA